MAEDFDSGDVASEQPECVELSEAERLVVEAACRGDVIDCKRQQIRGRVLKLLIDDILPGWQVSAAGIRINRAIVTGGLDLEGSTFAKPIIIRHSRIEGGGDNGTVLLRDARLKRLGIHSSTIEGAIIADRVQIDNGFFLGGGVVSGRLSIRGAEIGGALAVDGTEIGDGNEAILAAGLRLIGPLILRRAKISGVVSLPRSNLGAGIYAEDAQFNAKEYAIDAESARIEGDLLFDRAVVAGRLGFPNARIGGRIAASGMSVDGGSIAFDGDGIDVRQGVDFTGASINGSVRLSGADIGKSFLAEGMQIEGGGEAIGADGIKIGVNWDMAGAKLVGSLSCAGADVGGQFRLTEARLFGADLALRADGARLRGGCYLSRSMVFGALRFPAVEVGNQFRLRGAALKVGSGVALLASGSRFMRDIELNGGFQSVGAIVLDQSEVAGNVDLSESKMVSAALAREMQPAKSSPPGKAGSVEQGWDETVLSLIDAKLTRLLLPSRVENRPRGIVDLSRARVGSYQDYSAAWPPEPEARGVSLEGREIDHLVLDGLTYDHLANPSGGEQMPGMHARSDDRVAHRRIAWLEGQAHCDIADHFKPQPWVQLGRRLGEQGYHDDARTISIARRRLELASHSSTAGQRWQGYILDLFALYGHNPWRTVTWMAAFIVLFAGIWGWAASNCSAPGCHDETVFVVTNRDAYSQETRQRFEQGYPAFNALGYSFDVFVPFVSFGYADHWRPNINWQPFAEIPIPDFISRGVEAVERSLTGAQDPLSRADGRRVNRVIVFSVGGILYILSVVETLLGLVLASLAVTGFTGLLRSD